MRYILNNIKLVNKFILIILIFLVFSCSDKEIKPFVGKKIDIHISNKYMASKNFVIEIDKPIENSYWPQKGGDDTHSVPNVNFKFPFNKIFSKNTDQKISDEHFILANPVVDKKNIYVLSTDGSVRSIDKNNFRINWKKQLKA